jgi:hypothetical protein
LQWANTCAMACEAAALVAGERRVS